MRIGKRPPKGPAEIKLEKILIAPSEREAFENLCKEGCEREWLAHLILWLANDRPSRNRKVYVNRTECRALGKRLARLAREFDDSRVRQWCWMHRKAPVAAEFYKPLRLVTNVSVSCFEPRPPVEFDVNVLCEQLQAAAEFLGQLGEAQERVACFLQVEDFDLQRLLAYVKKQTEKAHNKEVSILCKAATSKAATGRHSANALKQRSYRARSGRRAQRSAGHRQTK